MFGESALRIRELLANAHGRTVLVLGSGVTGRAVARFVSGRGVKVAVLDEREIATPIREELARIPGVKLFDRFTAEHVPSLPSDAAFAVVSPGIPLEGTFVRALSPLGLPKVSELDLGVAFLGMPLVAVTGTNGKTTTASLIAHLLDSSGREVSLVGNIGRPFVDVISGEAEDSEPSQYADLVAEVSSYQLESAVDFAPHISVWLNLDENHLERHGSMGDYLRAKARIFTSQRESDAAVLCSDDRYFSKMREYVRGKLYVFGEDAPHLRGNEGVFLLSDRSELLIRLFGREQRLSLASSRLLGRHNRLNIAAALTAAQLAGATVEECQESIPTFAPIEHRLEFVRELRGVAYINDTKATTVAATATALDALRDEFPKREVILLVGGQAKYGSWDGVRERIDRSCRDVIGFGGDREKVLQALGASESSPIPRRTQFHVASTLRDAVLAAAEFGRPGDIVLLSPGCASFDAYANYEERGRDFKSTVMALG